ncbi:MAG: formylglycine-rating enzyme family protein [Gammaproteobacteria bacterium]|nr:formylglycine-rating enzyme family protein [Gammaproteobacteria bacterium]
MLTRSTSAAARFALGLACCLVPIAGAWSRQPPADANRCATEHEAGHTIGSNCSIGKRGLVMIPAGYYLPFFKQKGAQSIPVAAFWLDAAPVTRKEYLDFVRRNPVWRRSQVKALFAEGTYLADWVNDLSPDGNFEDPVTFVSWFAARAFCADRDQRLPTVAEWERTAGAGNSTTDAFDTAAAQSQAPFRFAMGRLAADVPSPSIAFGKTWEWTADFNSAMALGDSTGANGRSNLFCGAGFRSNNATDYAAFLRYSFRSSLRANYTLKTLGFRCAR